MEVVDVKTKAKVILKEMMEQSPDDHDLTAIWDVWFERMADSVHLVYLNPTQLAELKQSFDNSYAELIAASGPFRPLNGLGNCRDARRSRFSYYSDHVLVLVPRRC